ncbi:MAG: hypothetical protein Q8P88_01815 [Candidatus Jorgensenbacteria bacterium]|nr:hypothetical protein [Candidatus Jorgensenbacteria bacterium]
MINTTQNESELRLPAHLKEVYLKNLERWRKIESLPQPPKDSARFGQIWSTEFRYKFHDGREKEVDETRFVLVLSDTKGSLLETMRDVRVVPLSYESEEASELDLILSQEVNPLGFEGMLEFWNTAQVFTCNLGRFLGEISDEQTLDQIEKLWKESLGLERSVPGAKTGTLITSSTDSRLDFQSEERRKTEYLREPVEYALATLG